MTIGIELRGVTTEIGPGGILHALCSTVSHNLEPSGWGTRFPKILNELYRGRLDAKHALEALNELRQIKSELKRIPPSGVIWDIENLALDPPWGKVVGPHVQNMSHYFVTDSGKDLIDILAEQVECLVDVGGSLEIVTMGQGGT